jgi:3-oxoacyl-ACP reductase-like protein
MSVDEIDIDGQYVLEIWQDTQGFQWKLKEIHTGKIFCSSSSPSKREALSQALQSINLKEAIRVRRKKMTDEQQPPKIDNLVRGLNSSERNQLLRKLLSEEGFSLTTSGGIQQPSVSQNVDTVIQLNFFGENAPDSLIDAIASRIKNQQNQE